MKPDDEADNPMWEACLLSFVVELPYFIDYFEHERQGQQLRLPDSPTGGRHAPRTDPTAT